MATTDRGLRAIARVQLALAVLFAVSFVVAVFAARTPYPYRDDWDWLAWRLDSPLSLSRFLSLHNEHLPLIPRLIFVVQFWIEKSRHDVMAVAALIEQLLVVAIIVNEARRHAWPSNVERTIAVAAGMSLLFFSWQLQSMLFATTITFPLVELFAVLTILCVVNGRGVGAFVASLLAMGTTSPGLFVPLVAAVVAFARRARAAFVVAFALLFLAGLTAYAMLIRSYYVPALRASFSQTLGLFFSFFASFASYRWPVVGLAIGVIVFGAGLFVLWPVLRRSASVSRLEQFAGGIVLFTMATALAIASARAGFGVGQGAQSRYATFVLPYWCMAWLVLWARVCRSGALVARRAIAAVALLVTLALLPLHLLTAIVWRAKSDNVSAAALALRSSVEDDGWLRTLHPQIALVTDTVARLRAAGDASFEMPPFSMSASETRALPACPASFLALPLTKSGDYELRSSLDVSGNRGYVLDEMARLVGLARPAPLVTSTEPSHRDVITAVLRELRHRSPPQWLGFSHSLSQAPAMVIIERDATPVCRASVRPSAG